MHLMLDTGILMEASEIPRKNHNIDVIFEYSDTYVNTSNINSHIFHWKINYSVKNCKLR